jgi:hypothetical protein
MKNFVLIICLALFISCKTDKKEKEIEVIKTSESLQVLKGAYLYYTDVAILQTPTEVYGVVLDDKTMALNKKVSSFKKLDTDMVPVEVKGNVIPKAEGEEGWPFKIQIKEILKVSKPIPENKDIITLGK